MYLSTDTVEHRMRGFDPIQVEPWDWYILCHLGTRAQNDSIDYYIHVLKCVIQNKTGK